MQLPIDEDEAMQELDVKDMCKHLVTIGGVFKLIVIETEFL